MSRSEIVSVRATAAETDLVRSAAAKRGMTVSAFMRDAGLRLAEQDRRRSAQAVTHEVAADGRELWISGTGTASCGHFSIGNVRAASCGYCGPLRVVRRAA